MMAVAANAGAARVKAATAAIVNFARVFMINLCFSDYEKRLGDLPDRNLNVVTKAEA